MGRVRKYTDQEIVAALREARGMVYHAAAKVGCEADTIYKRSRSSPAVAAAMRAERGKVLDTAESKLFDAIEGGEVWAVTFALRMLAKDRGYVERQEHQHTLGDDDLAADIRKRLDEVDGPRPGQPGEARGGVPPGVADAAPPAGD